MTDAATIAIIIAASIVVLSYGLLGLKRWRRLPVTLESQMSDEIKKLRATLDVVMADRVRDQNRITELESALFAAQRRISELEYILKDICPPDIVPPRPQVRRKLLVGIGPDPALNVDLAALRKVETQTGMKWVRRMPATFDNLKSDLDRARVSGFPFEYMHLAAHMSEQGVELGDGRGGAAIVSALKLSEILHDVEVLVLAGCESTSLGDFLGVVPAVITMREEVFHTDAMNFTDVFWREIGRGADPEDAFYTTLDRVPAVAEFAEFHK